jgi:hypothetical protein
MSNNQPTQTRAPQPPPERKPYGPGPLMVFGLALLVVSGYCFYDLFLGGKAEEWAKAGSQGTIIMNWGGMVAAAAAAVYCFVMAVRRSKKPQEQA